MITKRMGFIQEPTQPQVAYYHPEEMEMFKAWFEELYGPLTEARDNDQWFNLRAQLLNGWMARANLAQEEGGPDGDLEVHFEDVHTVPDNGTSAG